MTLCIRAQDFVKVMDAVNDGVRAFAVRVKQWFASIPVVVLKPFATVSVHATRAGPLVTRHGHCSLTTAYAARAGA